MQNNHTMSNIYLSQVLRVGLFFELSFKCSLCRDIFKLKNSEKVNISEDQSEYSINLQTVLGGISTGTGYSSHREILALMGIRFFSQNKYTKIFNFYGKMISDEFDKSCDFYKKEEIAIAKTNHNIYGNGHPAITCIGDA